MEHGRGWVRKGAVALAGAGPNLPEGATRMAEGGFFAGGLVFLAILTVGMYRLGRKTGGGYWAGAWVALYLAGASATLAGSPPQLGYLYPAFGVAFAALFYAGARCFGGRTAPSWLWPAAAALAVLRALTQPMLSETAIQYTGAAVITAASLAALWEILRAARGPGATGFDYLVAGATLLLPLTTCFYAYSRSTGVGVDLGLLAWLLTGVLIAGSQCGALFSRMARRSHDERATLASVIDSMRVGVAFTGRDGAVRTLNAAFAQQLGPEAAEHWVGRPLGQVADRVRSLVEPGDAAAIAGVGDPHADPDIEIESRELLFRDGRTAVAEMRRVRDREGLPVGRLWFLRDVSAERRLEQELRQSRQLERLGALAGGVAHDFNNKLTTILGNVSAVRDTLAGEDSRHAALNDLEGAAVYCARLTRDLLDFAQQSPRSPKAIDVGRFLQPLARRIRGALPEGVNLSLDAAPGVTVLADEGHLERVVDNLVHNARDAVGARGHIEVSAARVPAGVEISVRDDGVGMDAATRERIFDPFFSTKEVGKGTGLGLAIVYGIVSSHGGEVQVETALGQGARFVTSWPAAEPAVLDSRRRGRRRRHSEPERYAPPAEPRG